LGNPRALVARNTKELSESVARPCVFLAGRRRRRTTNTSFKKTSVDDFFLTVCALAQTFHIRNNQPPPQKLKLCLTHHHEHKSQMEKPQSRKASEEDPDTKTDSSDDDDDKDENETEPKKECRAKRACLTPEDEDEEEQAAKRAKKERFELIQELASRNSFKLYEITWTCASSRHILTLMSDHKWIVHAEKIQHGVSNITCHFPGLKFRDAAKSFCARVRGSWGLPAKIMVVDQLSLQFNMVDWVPPKQKVALHGQDELKKMLKSIFTQTTGAQLRNCMDCMDSDNFDATIDVF
jgi:hypothetical protein